MHVGDGAEALGRFAVAVAEGFVVECDTAPKVVADAGDEFAAAEVGGVVVQRHGACAVADAGHAAVGFAFDAEFAPVRVGNFSEVVDNTLVGAGDAGDEGAAFEGAGIGVKGPAPSLVRVAPAKRASPVRVKVPLSLPMVPLGDTVGGLPAGRCLMKLA